MLALAKRLSEQTLEPVAHNRIAARLTDGNAETRITTVVFRDIDRKQPVTETSTPFVRQYGSKLPVAYKPFLFWKRKSLHGMSYHTRCWKRLKIMRDFCAYGKNRLIRLLIRYLTGLLECNLRQNRPNNLKENACGGDRGKY